MTRGDTYQQNIRRIRYSEGHLLAATLSTLCLLLRDLGSRRTVRPGGLGLRSLLFLLLALGFLDGSRSLSGPDLCTLVPLRED